METETSDDNKITITFVSLQQSCFIETSKNIMLSFLPLFEHKRGVEGFDFLVEAIQCNSTDLRRRITVFIDFYTKYFPALNGLRTFLSLLPENHYFIILQGKLTDTATHLQYFTFLTRYHNERGMQQRVDERFFDWGETLKFYNMRNFGHQTRSVGAHVVKEKRICRFCNTVNGGTNAFGSVVTFLKRSHAYSEALGNKHVISKDECDACNQRFSVGCELSLINLLSPFRSIHGLKGKKGKKKLVGKNFSLDPEKGFDIKYDGTIDPTEKIERLEIQLELRETIVPHDVYRCLVKFVISTVDPTELKFLSKTIDWVNGNFDADKLPKVCILQAGNYYKEQPLLSHYLRKKEDSLPYMVGEFHYADIVYVFIVPFCLNDKVDFTDENRFNDYWQIFNSIRSNYQWSMKDFSGTRPINMQLNLSIEGMDFGENTFVELVE